MPGPPCLSLLKLAFLYQNNHLLTQPCMAVRLVGDVEFQTGIHARITCLLLALFGLLCDCVLGFTSPSQGARIGA
jgi:hypothetical protein